MIDDLICDDCLVPNTLSDPVKKGNCPYEKEINDEEVSVKLCSDCYDYRGMEIDIYREVERQHKGEG